MKRYCPNTKAQKKMKCPISASFDVKIEGKDKYVYYLDDKKFYESNKEFFEDNFFAVQAGKAENAESEK